MPRNPPASPDDRLPRGIIIASGAPRHVRAPFWAYFWSTAEEPAEEEVRIRSGESPPGPALAPAR